MMKALFDFFDNNTLHFLQARCLFHRDRWGGLLACLFSKSKGNHYKQFVGLFLISLFSVVWLTGTIAVATIPALDTATLLQQAQTSYQKGDFQQSQQLWQTLVKQFAAQDDPLNQAMALSNLSLTAQQLGNWETATTAITASQNLLKQANSSPEQQQILAQSLAIQGQLDFNQGRADQALQTWQETAKLYRELDNISGEINSQINQAQAYQELGMYPPACQTLFKIVGITQKDCSLPPRTTDQIIDFPANLPPATQLLILRNLGNLFRLVGQTQNSYRLLAQGRQLAKANNFSAQLADFDLSLGNTARAIANQKVTEQERKLSIKLNVESSCLSDPAQGRSIKFYRQAAACYRQVIDSQTKGNIRLQAQLNLLNLALQLRSWSELQGLISPIEQALNSFPHDRTEIAARLKLAQALMCVQWELNRGQNPPLPPPILQSCPNETSQKELATAFPGGINDALLPNLVQTALDQAQRLGDPQLIADAFGYLGAIAYLQRDYARALKWTEQARLQASNFNHPEIAYLWQWQLGRILQQQGQIPQAIAAYKNAYALLQSLRQALVGANADLQFTFRDQVEPLYRELVDLLLQSTLPEQEKLQQAREIIEALQVAELNNFFQEACLEGDIQPVEAIDDGTALIYAIILPKRLAVIVALANRPLQLYETPLQTANKTPNSGSQEIASVVGELLRNTLNGVITVDPSRNEMDLRPNQQLYDWLIRPLEPTLKSNSIETLVFVLDSGLRGIPIATLHDGKQYLLENYNIALLPSLRLLSSNKNANFTLQQANTLVGGLIEARQGFDALPGVEQEVQNITERFPSEVLLNENFTPSNLQTKLSHTRFPIVHLATHAQFSSKAEDTFLLTWDDRINVKNLDQLLRETEEQIQPIELLVLSACQTATGDDRAPLGLAGVAVRSGAKSTLATLWPVNDESTSLLMAAFYSAFNQPGVSKAQAIRQAQLTLFHNPNYQHPYYWGPFVLIGHWQ